MVPIGQRLRDKRIERKLSINDVAISLKIKPQFLEAIEKGDYKRLPSPAYAQGFVRNYADYLGLPKAQTSALFKRDFDEKKAIKVLPDGISRTKEYKKSRLNFRNVILNGIVLIIAISFLVFQTKTQFMSPSLRISSPKDGSEVAKEVSVIGRTDKNATVTVNNEPVAINNNGEFSKKLSLFPGKTTITVKAMNRLGKETIKSESVIVKP